MSRHLPLLALVLAAPAAAQQEVTVVVTASRTGEGGAGALSAITAADIARVQPVTLLDALNGTAGVRAISTGGVGGGSFLSIRGGEPNFTLVLVDGIRVNDGTNSKGGAFDFSLIDPALVERLEVSRGATSAVHGSDALSGVVNIRLRDSGEGAGGRVTADTAGELGAGATLATGGLLLGGAVYDSNGAEPGSTLRRAQGLARAKRTLGDYDLVALGLYARTERRAFPEDSGGPRRAVNRAREEGDGSLWTAALSLRHRPEGALRPHLSLSFARQRSEADTPAIFPGVLQGVPAITADNRLDRVEAIGDVVAVLGPVTTTVGAAYLDEDGRSRGTVDFGFPVPAGFTLKRQTASAFAEATMEPMSGLALNAAVRHDRVDGGPKEWTGRAGASWRVAEGAPTLFVRYGEGFKLPSFYALASPLIGNPALRPERSRNVEGGVQWALADGLDLRAAAFRTRFRDLVDFDPVTFTSVNRARVTVKGLEAELGWRPVEGVTLAGAVTHLDVGGAPLRQRPGWAGSLSAQWQATSAVSLGGRLRSDDGFLDSSVPTGLVRRSGHAELDANLSWRLAAALRLDLALRNLTDADERQAVGFPGIGRTLRATLVVGAF